MSLYGTYDPNNIFAKIIRGEAPCHRVFEDDNNLAFMDAFPQASGHVLVIPKRGTARNILEIEPDQLNLLSQCAQKIARAVADELKPDGLLLFQANGGAGHQSVYHIHVHVIPRWAGQPLAFHAQNAGDPEELKRLAARLSARLSTYASR